jgi:hypothetical protein
VLRVAHPVELAFDLGGALGQDAAELGSLGFELVVTEVFKLLLVPVNLLDHRLELLALPIKAGPEKLGDNLVDHSFLVSS